jgi:hypothetical protein
VMAPSRSPTRGRVASMMGRDFSESIVTPWVRGV